MLFEWVSAQRRRSDDVTGTRDPNTMEAIMDTKAQVAEGILAGASMRWLDAASVMKLESDDADAARRAEANILT
jgi:hypothetical protein